MITPKECEVIMEAVQDMFKKRGLPYMVCECTITDTSNGYLWNDSATITIHKVGDSSIISAINEIIKSNTEIVPDSRDGWMLKGGDEK